MKTSTSVLVFASMVAAGAMIACGGNVAGSNSENPSPSPSSTSTSPSASATATSTSNPPDPGTGGPAIIVDGTAAAGRFTALALNGPSVWVAEVVDDASTGAPTSATTIWRLSSDGTKTAVIASADIGNPFGMIIVDTTGSESGSTTPYWIDGFAPFGALKSISNNAVSTLSTDVLGTMLVNDVTGLYGEYTSPSDVACIASIARAGGASPACAVSDYAVPLQGGSGFRIVNGVMYAATPSLFVTLDLTSSTTTEKALPSALVTALGPNDSNGAVYDVDIAADGTAYFATQIGVWKMDTAGNFSNAWGSDIVQQIAIKGNVLLALIVGQNGVSIQQYWLDGTEPERTITNDAQLDTRFATDETNVYWLDPLGTSALHTAY